MIEGRIIELLEQKFVEPDWQDCFVVEVKQHATNKLEVFMDSDDGITFEKCRKISRYLEEFLDKHLWLGEKYTLDVSSPGISRPLVLKRQYQKNVGRKVEIKLKEEQQSEKYEGELIGVVEDAIILKTSVTTKEGKKKKTEIKELNIPIEHIAQTKVKISFN
jgi:ribosome maturation factor RimP